MPGGKIWTVMDMLEAQGGQVGERETLGGASLKGSPHICKFYFQEHYQVLTVKMG